MSFRILSPIGPGMADFQTTVHNPNVETLSVEFDTPTGKLIASCSIKTKDLNAYGGVDPSFAKETLRPLLRAALEALG